MTTLAKSTQMEFTDGSGRSIAPVDIPHPLVILSDLARNGGDIAVIEKVSSLAERWQANEARAQYNLAMAAAQKEMPVVVADAENTQTRSRYAKRETIQQKIKEVCLKHGFTVTVAEDGPPIDGVMNIIATVRHIGGHAEVFRRYAPADTLGPKGTPNKTPVQGAQSTISYVARRLECEIFGVVVVGEDNDGAGAPDPFITKEQLSELSQTLTEAKRDIPAFLKMYEIDSLGELQQSKFREFMQSIRLMKATAKNKESK